MDGATIITVVTTITGALVTIVTIIIKDRQDQRRWDRERAAMEARHAENSQKLDANTAKLATVEREVNGKVDHLVAIAHDVGYERGKVDTIVATATGKEETSP